MKYLAALFCLLFVSAAFAQEKYDQKPPTQGDWKDQPPGTFVITKQSRRADQFSLPKITFQKELLLGADDQGRGWFSVYKSDSADGPWQYSFGHGGGSQFFNSPQTKLLGSEEKELKIGEHVFPCTVTRYEYLDDASISTGERWVDRASDFELQSTLTTKPRDADAPPFEHTFQTRTTAVEARTIADHACTVFIQEWTNSPIARNMGTRRLEATPDLPGHRLSFTTWTSADTTAAPISQTEFVATGTDPAALAEERQKLDKRTIDPHANFHADALADAESDDPVRKARGLGLIAMNEFKPEFHDRIEKVVRAGLADEDVKIHRPAAAAAGMQHITSTSKRIVELAHRDTNNDGEYLRALGRLAEPEGLDFVLNAVQSNKRMPGYGIQALVNFSDERATEALKQMLQDPKPRVRSNVVSELANAKNPHATELLLSMSNDPDASVRSVVMMSLAQRGNPSHLVRDPALQNDPAAPVRDTTPGALDAAIKALGDPSPQVQLVATMAVGAIGKAAPDAKRASDTLFQLTTEKTPFQQRFTAIVMLARMNDLRAVPMLKALATSPPQNIELGFGAQSDSLAMETLATMTSPEALQAIAELTSDPAQSKRALDTLRRSRSPGAAKLAWQMYREIPPATAPATAPAPSPATRPTGGRMVRSEAQDRQAELLTIVATQADKSLRDEIELAIPSCHWSRRPELRRTVRMIDERLAREQQSRAR